MSDESAVTFQNHSHQPISPYTLTAHKLSDWRGAVEYFVQLTVLTMMSAKEVPM
jgi:hypothetical protein